MKSSTVRTFLLALAFASASTVAICQGSNDSTAPDLHGDGASPSTIPNHVVTQVSLPGLHLTGTTVTVSGVCTLQSFQVVSDTQIRVMITGNRTPDDKDGRCSLQVNQGTKQASTSVVVN